MQSEVQRALETVFSSQRSAPARFSSFRDRECSFCIDFEPLDASSDYEMAGLSWLLFHEFVPQEHQKAIGKAYCVPLMCGEDIMVGVFIITKLGAPQLVDELKLAIIEETIRRSKQPNPRGLVEAECVKSYLQKCAEIGRNKARG